MPPQERNPQPPPGEAHSTAARLSPQDIERRYLALFEQTRDAIFLLDIHGNHLAVNRRAAEMLGYTVEELCRMSLKDIVARREQGRAQQVLTGLLAGKTLPLYERMFRKRDGTEFPVEINVSLIRDQRGEPLYIQSIVRDISRRKLEERLLRESEERYRSAIASLAEGVLLVDEQLVIRAANQSAKRILNRGLDRIIGAHPWELWGPTAMTEGGRPFSREQFPVMLTVSTGQPQTDVVMWIERPEMERVWISVNTQPLRHPGDKQPHSILVSFFDITARKRAELAEREQRSLSEALGANILAIASSLDLEDVLRRILHNMSPVLPYDMANIMLVEAGVARVVRGEGYSGEMLAEIMRLTFPVDEVPSFKQMSESGQPIIVSEAREDPNWIAGSEGQRDWLRSYLGAPILLEGQVIGFLNIDSLEPHTFTDQHAERLKTFADQVAIAVHNAQLYESVRQHAAELEDRNAELDAFSHTVAHDLKAPLQGIIGYSNLLSEMIPVDAPGEVGQTLEMIPRHAFKMSQIIDSLLLLAGLRDATVSLGPVAMQPVVEDALMRFQQTIADRGVAVTVDPDLPPALGYGPWLEEVLANLIGNAVKYIGRENPEPRIAIHGYHYGDVVRYEVEDNGLGIKPENRQLLFQKFARFHRGESKGHGLGLSIVERIVARLGGTLGVESEVGKGSIFWFALPRPEQA